VAPGQGAASVEQGESVGDSWNAAVMSGFTRDPKRYGDKLVYEALGSKRRRYHDQVLLSCCRLPPSMRRLT
jgi:hypothetical protein